MYHVAVAPPDCENSYANFGSRSDKLTVLKAPVRCSAQETTPPCSHQRRRLSPRLIAAITECSDARVERERRRYSSRFAPLRSVSARSSVDQSRRALTTRRREILAVRSAQRSIAARRSSRASERPMGYECALLRAQLCQAVAAAR